MNGTAAPNRWLVLLSMTGSLSMILLDQTVVTVALPSMARDLHLSAGGQQWVVSTYVLTMAAVVALGGKLGDRFGGVPVFKVGVTVFFVASALCGLAPTGEWGEIWIIAARSAQGLGAAMMMPVSAAIVVSSFAVEERGRAMAVYAGVSQVFLAIGPLVGGLLTESVTWRAVFWLNIPVGIAALVLVQIAKPVSHPAPDSRIQIGSVVLLVTGVGATVLGIQQSSSWSWGSPLTLGLILGGVAVLTLFTVLQLHSDNPLIQVRLFGERPFLGDLVVLAFLQFGLLAVVLYSSLFFQDLLHMSPVRAGAATMPLVISLAIAAQLGGRWYDRAGVRPPVLTGMAVASVGLVAWCVALPRLDYAWQLPGMVLTGFGIGLVMSPGNTDALSRASLRYRSQAAGLVQTVRQLGGTLGVAVIGSIVLGLEEGGSTSQDPDAAAHAITVGFGVAAASFVIAVVAGWFLLSHQRISDDGPAIPAPSG